MKLLIIGHARHGKDTVADFLRQHFSLQFQSSSEAAAEIFLYSQLRPKYNYQTFYECFEDRMNHRKEWHDAITAYNTPDKSRLAKSIMQNNDIYVGMRSKAEIDACMKERVFDLVVGVYNPRLPFEEPDSFSIDIWEMSDIIIPNAGTLDQLHRKVGNLPIYKCE